MDCLAVKTKSGEFVRRVRSQAISAFIKRGRKGTAGFDIDEQDLDRELLASVVAHWNQMVARRGDELSPEELKFFEKLNQKFSEMSDSTIAALQLVFLETGVATLVDNTLSAQADNDHTAAVLCYFLSNLLIQAPAQVSRAIFDACCRDFYTENLLTTNIALLELVLMGWINFLEVNRDEAEALRMANFVSDIYSHILTIDAVAEIQSRGMLNLYGLFVALLGMYTSSADPHVIHELLTVIMDVMEDSFRMFDGIWPQVYQYDLISLFGDVLSGIPISSRPVIEKFKYLPQLLQEIIHVLANKTPIYSSDKKNIRVVFSWVLMQAANILDRSLCFNLARLGFFGVLQDQIESASIEESIYLLKTASMAMIKMQPKFGEPGDPQESVSMANLMSDPHSFMLSFLGKMVHSVDNNEVTVASLEFFDRLSRFDHDFLRDFALKHPETLDAFTPILANRKTNVQILRLTTSCLSFLCDIAVTINGHGGGFHPFVDRIRMDNSILEAFDCIVLERNDEAAREMEEIIKRYGLNEKHSDA